MVVFGNLGAPRSPPLRWIDGSDEFAGDGGKLLFGKFRRCPVIEPRRQP